MTAEVREEIRPVPGAEAAKRAINLGQKRNDLGDSLFGSPLLS